MSEKEVDLEILRAMDKLERDSDIINQKKLVLQQKKRKISIVSLEPSLDKKTRYKTIEFNKALFNEIKFKLVLGLGSFVITLVIVNSLSTAKEFSIIEHFVVFLCCLGMVASKWSND